MPRKAETGVKTGVKTSEFWTTIADKLSGLGLVAMGIWSEVPPEAAWGLIASGVAMIIGGQASYNLGRALVKRGKG
jgi:hypothetical protein